MTDNVARPVSASERIGEVDIIRGFALFGVLWINLFGQTEYIVSADGLIHLWGERLDVYVGAFTDWVGSGKAQCLFSLLFGFGFAILSDRVEARGANAGALYLRRILILLVVGFAHLFLLWAGDILHAYALMGLVLMTTRKWPSRLLLGLGLGLAIGSGVAAILALMAMTPPGQQPAFVVLVEQGLARRWDIFLGHDYFAYVRELVLISGPEFYFTVFGPAFLGTILGRFMIGAWIHRQGWLEDTARYARGFRLALPWLLVGGLLLAAVDPGMDLLDLRLPRPFRPALEALHTLSQLVLALGYGCGLVVLCQSEAWRRRLKGLGAVGQMALTNYLTHSLVYMFVLNGFGLGLLRYAGPTFCLGLAVVVFALQIVFSLWWLARYRFGPAEWLWRSATYGRWQPLRREDVSGTTA